MRFDLKVPFAEKDAAKKLGARWDAARKLWYVADKADMTLFSKWSPVLHDASASVLVGKAPAAASRRVMETNGKVQVGSAYVAQASVCGCPPWEVCDTCRPLALPSRS